MTMKQYSVSTRHSDQAKEQPLQWQSLIHKTSNNATPKPTSKTIS